MAATFPGSSGGEPMQERQAAESVPGRSESPWFAGRPAGQGWPDYQILTPAEEAETPYRLSRAVQIYTLLLPVMVALLYFLLPILLDE